MSNWWELKLQIRERKEFTVCSRCSSLQQWWITLNSFLLSATRHAKSIQMRVAWLQSHDWPSSGSTHTKTCFPFGLYLLFKKKNKKISDYFCTPSKFCCCVHRQKPFKGKMCACAVIKWGVTKILLWAKTTTSFQNSWFSASEPFSSPRDRKRILCPRLQAHLSTFIVAIFTQWFIFFSILS